MTLLLAVLPLPAFATEPVTSEQALENYRLMTVEPPRCAEGGDPDDINVCGRRAPRNAYRLPLPVEPTAGKRIQGEAVSAVAAAEVRDKCSAVGRAQSCGGGLPIMGMAIFLAKVIEKKLINPDE